MLGCSRYVGDGDVGVSRGGGRWGLGDVVFGEIRARERERVELELEA